MWPNCILLFFKNQDISTQESNILGAFCDMNVSVYHSQMFEVFFFVHMYFEFIFMSDLYLGLINKLFLIILKITFSFFLQDVEVPLHLLRYVCLFCGKNGLSLMKDCFEFGTPETLPFLIAHAFITVVSNVSIVWNWF